MFKVTRMKPTDYSSAVELANTMNWHMTAEDFAFNVTLEPDGCLALREGSELVGVATCISYGVVGWFGNLVVKEAYRRKGAGAALVNHAVNCLKAAGVKTVGLYAYPHLKDFYGRLGFKSNTDFVVLKANSVSTTSVEEGNVRAMQPEDLPKIAAFDGEYFGASRKKLLDLILQNPTNLSNVALVNNETVGYVAAKVFGDTAEVGPLICQQNHPEAAAALLKTVLTQLAGFEAFIYLPAAHSELLRVAFDAGFVEGFRLSRMFLGSVVLQDCLYIAESLERG